MKLKRHAKFAKLVKTVMIVVKIVKSAKFKKKKIHFYMRVKTPLNRKVCIHEHC